MLVVGLSTEHSLCLQFFEILSRVSPSLFHKTLFLTAEKKMEDAPHPTMENTDFGKVLLRFRPGLWFAKVRGEPHALPEVEAGITRPLEQPDPEASPPPRPEVGSSTLPRILKKLGPS